ATLSLAAAWWANADTRIGDLQFFRIAAREPIRFAAALTAFAIVAFAWAWKRIVNSHVLGLVGRGWLVAEVVLWVVGAVTLTTMLEFLEHAGWRVDKKEFWPVFWLSFIVCRVLVTLWILRLSLQRGVLDWRTVGRGLAVWIGLASAVIGLLIWVY